MLSDIQIDHYLTFGFVILPAFLSDVSRTLADEVNAAITDAYQATYDQRDTDGISGHYLPMASRYTPLSASLICDDPRFVRAAQALLGGPVIPECPEGVLYFFDAGWHNDDGIGVEGVKFATYFDALQADSGALRFIPGSQRREQQPRLRSYRQAWMATGRRDIDGSPGRITATNPGDVVAFDLHTWHASFGGRDRLAWDHHLPALPRNGGAAGTGTALHARQFRAVLPRVRPYPLSDLEGLARRLGQLPPPR